MSWRNKHTICALLVALFSVIAGYLEYQAGHYRSFGISIGITGLLVGLAYSGHLLEMWGETLEQWDNTYENYIRLAEAYEQLEAELDETTGGQE